MKPVLIIVLFVVLAIGGFLLYTLVTKDSTTTGPGEHMMEDGTIMEDNAMMDSEDEMMAENSEEDIQETTEARNSLAGSITPYYEFEKDLYDKALQDNKVILLYFYADWCPICKKEQADATLPAFNELQNPNVLGFRVHYNDGKVSSEEISLAKQFGITYQHTKIILKDGKQVLKDLNSWTKVRYLEELNKY